MRFGRDSLILVVLPLLFLGAAFLLLFHGRGDAAGPAVRFASSEAVPAQSEGGAGPLLRLRPVAPRTMPAPADPDAPTTSPAIPATGHEDPALDPALPDPEGGAPGRGAGAPPGPGAGPEPFRGTVTDRSGRPLAGAVIEVRERRNLFSRDLGQHDGDPMTRRLRSDRNGEFSVPRLEGHVVDLHISASGMAPVVARPFGGAATVFELPAAGSVRGAVTDARDGIPLSGVRVRLVGEGFVQDALSGDDGRFTFEAAPVGWVNLEVSHGGFVAQRRRFFLASGADRIENVPLQPGILLEGMVIDGETQEPLEAIPVTVFDRFMLLEVASVTTGRDGRFRVSALEPGALYEVRALHDELGQASARVQLPASASPEPVILELQPTWTLKGQVSDRGRTPLGGVSVEAFVDDGGVPRFFGRVSTTEEGQFSIPGLPAEGTVEILVLPPEHAVTARRGLNRIDDASRHHDIEVDPMGVVLGHVLLPGGAGAAGALVRVTVETAVRDQLIPIQLFTYADATGAYRIPNLPGGAAVLKTLLPGYRNQTLPVTVVPLQVVERDVTLEAFPRGPAPH